MSGRGGAQARSTKLPALPVTQSPSGRGSGSAAMGLRAGLCNQAVAVVSPASTRARLLWCDKRVKCPCNCLRADPSEGKESGTEPSKRMSDWLRTSQVGGTCSLDRSIGTRPHNVYRGRAAGAVVSTPPSLSLAHTHIQAPRNSEPKVYMAVMTPRSNSIRAPRSPIVLSRRCSW